MGKVLEVKDEALKALEKFKMPSGPIGFGTIMSPIMASADFKNGEWGPLTLLPYGPISLEPCAKVFHYAQEAFEGMKAYKPEGQEFPCLFRPDENMNRFNYSARRLAMPEVPENYFMEAVHGITFLNREFIPRKSGSSLYIRPFIFATQAHIGIKPSDSYKFLVIASPSESYFSTGSIDVFIQRKYVRAVKGGTGDAKVGGNYAASLLSSEQAFKNGYQQSLWLDAETKKNVEELSGMNFFAIINGELFTPALTDSILSGITRKSIIQLADKLGLKAHEVTLNIDELIEKIKSQECTECFACGTAAIVTPIGSLSDDNGRYELKHSVGETTLKIKQALLDIQERRSEDPFNWVQVIDSI